MALYNLIRLALVALAVWFLYRTLKRWIGGGREPQRDIPRRADGVIDEMVQDPQCGTYLPRQEAIKSWVRGQERFFCSPQCRDAYKAGKPPQEDNNQA